MTKSVSVIIPTLNRGEVLLNTLKDLLRQKYPDFEIIVVDQTDRPVKEVLDFTGKNPKIIYKHVLQKGTSNAKNIGAKLAKDEIFIFLDDDVKIDDLDFITNHVKNYDDKDIGAIGGRVLMKPYRDASTISEVGKFKYWGLKEITNFDANFRTQIDHVYGCNQSYRSRVFNSVGGFSEVYEGNAHLEEADLSLRVKKAGYKIYFDPTACLKHLYSSSGGCRVKDIYEFRYWLVHNYTIFYLRNYPKVLFPVFYLRQIVLAILSSLKRWDFKMFKVRYKALGDGIKYYKEDRKRKVENR